MQVVAHLPVQVAGGELAVGHDPGEPNNVEDVRIRVHRDLEHATLTYRGRGLEIDIPTTVTPTWAC